MALEKTIELRDGVSVGYHRVSCVSILTNGADVIEVTSYTCAAKRAEEKAAGPGDVIDVFQHTEAYEAPYDQEMTVAGAYAWLKSNVEAFADAEDVLEDGQEAADGDA